MKRLAGLVLVALTAVGAGAAQTPVPNEPMTQQALQAELYGIRMSGIEINTGQRWSECIEPGGTTVYITEGARSEGLLAITEANEACFTYPGSGTSCFRVQRAPKGYMFRGYGSAYHASKIERGVKSCVASELIG